jgi:glycosyltransferase involved in cell wall biosynthesis
MHKKHILLVCNGYPTERLPYRSTHPKTIKHCLEEAGYEVSLLVLNLDYSGVIGKVQNYFKFFKDLYKTDYSKYDSVYINYWPFIYPPFIFRKLNNENIYLHWHGGDINAEEKWKSIVNKLSFAFIPKQAIFISPSSFFKKELHRQIDPNRKILISPSGGVNTDDFSFTTNNIENGKIVFGFSSKIHRRKGSFLILDAIKILKKNRPDLYENFVFTCIGYGEHYEEFKKSASQFNEKIIYRPKRPRSEMPAFYKEFNVLLFPTARDGESLGLVALESMASGRPVIATNAFAVPDYVIDGKTGYLCEMNNPESLFNQIVKIMDHPEFLADSASACRKLVVENFSEQFVINQYKEFFK